jgi:predicted metal-dependent phosphoesterase TrpH
MNRRKFLKNITGYGLGLAAANLALPFALKARAAAPISTLLAKNVLDDQISAQVSAWKSTHPTWKVGETHCHSLYSDGTFEIADIAQRGERLGLDFVVITEHLIQKIFPLENTIASLKERRRCIESGIVSANRQFTLYPGFEASTEQGHLILVFPEEYLKPAKRSEIEKQFHPWDRKMPSVEDAVKLGNALGGASIVPHPNLNRGYTFGVTTDFIKAHLTGLVHAIEDVSTGHGYNKTYSQELDLASVGSSDDHFNFIIGTTITAYDSALYPDLPTALAARGTQAVKLVDSLDDLFSAARMIL